MIFSILEGKMRDAIELEENRNADGSINWNFVDADCYMDLIDFFRSTTDFYEAFNDIAEMIEGEFPVDPAVQLTLAI
jgi:hypothetical protein